MLLRVAANVGEEPIEDALATLPDTYAAAVAGFRNV